MRKTLGLFALCFIVLIESCSMERVQDDPKVMETKKLADIELHYQSFELHIPQIQLNNGEKLASPKVVTVETRTPDEVAVVDSSQDQVELILDEIRIDNEIDSAEDETIDSTTTELLPESFNLFRADPVSIVRKAEVFSFCQKIDHRLKSVTFRSCLTPELNSSHYQSGNQEPIFYTDYPELSTRPSYGRVLLLGGVHGDELSSVSTVFMWMNTLNKHHSGMFTWRIVPLVNPDGFFLPKPSRTNANGVDLNRNMPTAKWDQLATKYWKNFAKESDRKFPGFQAASEPETRWLVDEIDKFKPDVIVTVHAPYNLVDYDAISRMDAPRRLGILPGKSLGTFPGSLGRYAGEQKNIPVITIELPHSNHMPAESDIKHIWIDLISWLRNNISNRSTSDYARKDSKDLLG